MSRKNVKLIVIFSKNKAQDCKHPQNDILRDINYFQKNLRSKQVHLIRF